MDNAITLYATDMNMNSMDLVEGIVKTILGDQATVTQKEDEYGAVITIHPNGTSIASVLGRSGSTIDAIRTLAKAIGINGKHRIKVEIIEDGKSKDRHTN